MAKAKFYAVVVGRKTGVYTEWSGPKGAQAQVIRYPGAKHKGFATRAEADEFMKTQSAEKSRNERLERKRKAVRVPRRVDQKCLPLVSPDHDITIYTDGGCIDNPGPGGYGIIITNGKKTKEFSDGYKLTTNNRMELMACIVALSQLKRNRSVLLFSDSKYVVDGISKGWAQRWRLNGWQTESKKNVENTDLWRQLLNAIEEHDVQFQWVKGHGGKRENERCDELAQRAARGDTLAVDEGYENSQNPSLF